MYTDAVLESPALLFAAGAGLLVYWRLLGGAFDARLYLALNFSLITIWAVRSQNPASLRAMALLFMLLVVLAYWATRPRRLAATAGRLLDIDTSGPVIAISGAAIVMNVQAGFDSIEAVLTLVEHRSEDARARYAGYVLLCGTWLTTHMICHAARRPRWSMMQRVALAAALAAAATGLSKASFMPILLTLLFVYAHRLGLLRMALLIGGGFVLTVLAVQRLFEGLSATDVAELLFYRIVKNVDVLDYVEELGRVAAEYPHASPWFPAWPWFQLTQTDFMVPGVWLYGMVFDDWRGFGPNPTFVGDLLLASQYLGIVFAPLFGILLRAADGTAYRVFLAMVCYSFLQDWNTACLCAALFLIVLALMQPFRRHRAGWLPGRVPDGPRPAPRRGAASGAAEPGGARHAAGAVALKPRPAE